MPLPESRSLATRIRGAALPLSAAATLLLLAGCGDSEPSSDAASETSDNSTVSTTAPDSTEAPGEGTDDDAAAEETAPAEPDALSEQEKYELLLSSEDLPARPESHTTHSGVSYFEENIAVEYTQYQDTFGDTECAVLMDRINVDLVGDDPLEGLAHIYSLPATVQDDDAEQEGEAYSPQVYVWALSYDQAVDTSEIWEDVYENCSDSQLATEDEYVEILPLELEDDHGLSLGGVSMLIHREGEPMEDGAAMRHSMTVDFGDNLVVLSAVGLDSEGFAALAEVQLEKLAGSLD